MVPPGRSLPLPFLPSPPELPAQMGEDGPRPTGLEGRSLPQLWSWLCQLPAVRLQTPRWPGTPHTSRALAMFATCGAGRPCLGPPTAPHPSPAQSGPRHGDIQDSAGFLARGWGRRAVQAACSVQGTCCGALSGAEGGVCWGPCGAGVTTGVVMDKHCRLGTARPVTPSPQSLRGRVDARGARAAISGATMAQEARAHGQELLLDQVPPST